MRNLLLVCLLLVGAALWAQDEGPVTIGGVTYDRVDPGEPFTPAPMPAQDWDLPAPTAAEKAAGLLTFVAQDPGDYRPARRPKAEEHASQLKTFLTPGEDEPVSFAVHTLAAVEGLTVQVDLQGAPVTAEVRHAHCWPQRTGWRSRQWYVTPELLLPCADGRKTIPAQRGVLQEVAFDVEAGQTVGFWLTLTALPDARPGTYVAQVTVISGGKAALRLPLEIEVLPFTLQRPADRWWLLYADRARWNAMSDEQIVAELRDYRRHGMDGLIEIPLGAPDLSELQAGKVTYDASEYRRYTALCAQAGLPGPHVIGSGGAGMVRDVVAPGRNLEDGDWPRAVTDGVAAVARAAMDATADIPAKWYYYGVDEPSGDNTYAIQDYQAWHAGGALTYATFYNLGFLEKASEFLNAPCFVSGLISAPQNSQMARETCERTGAEFWWYGTGSYVNPFPQEGFVWHNRYGAGLLFWKSGAKAEATWTFCRPHEDVFNDFDGSAANAGEPKEQATAYPHLLRPDDYGTYQGAIPTLAWEGLREGVDDYLYLHTLRELIVQAAASPQAAVREAGAAAREELDAVVEAVPWANCMGPNGFPTTRLQQVRRLAATRIVALQAALRGQTGIGPAPERYALTLQVRTEAAAAATPAPVLPVMPATARPTIDGDLGDPCWQTGATAGDFHNTYTGAPVAIQTTARLLYDDEGLYVAFECQEPRMAALQTKETAHDGSVWLEDSVEFFVAGASRRPYAHLIVTAAGVVLDELNQDLAAWNPTLEVAARRGPAAWTVELALPWAELRAAGVERQAAMTVNFGRNRHTGQADPAASAWACTYGGFHAPERFGMALLQAGPVALCGLGVPREWGAQELTVGVRNLTAKGLTADLGLRGSGRRSVQLAPGAARTVAFPVHLRRSGQRPLSLSWGQAGKTPAALELMAHIPPPVEFAHYGGLVSPGSSLDLPLRLSLSPTEQTRHRLQLRLRDAGGDRVLDLPARPGQHATADLQAAGRVTVAASLVDDIGRTAWASPETVFLVLPE